MPSTDMGWVLSRRAFSIADAEGVIIGYARSIWMVLNTSDRSNAGLSGLKFNPEWISDRECPIPMQEKHIRIEADDKARCHSPNPLLSPPLLTAPQLNAVDSSKNMRCWSKSS